MTHIHTQSFMRYAILVAGIMVMSMVPTLFANAQSSVLFTTNVNLPERFQGQVPAVRFVNAQQIDDGTIVIEWYTTQYTNGKVVFSRQAAMNSEYNAAVRSTGKGWRHMVELPELEDDTIYFFYVMSENAGYHTARSEPHAFRTGKNGGEIDIEEARDEVGDYTPDAPVTQTDTI